jgi:hypothetical protein
MNHRVYLSKRESSSANGSGCVGTIYFIYNYILYLVLDKYMFTGSMPYIYIYIYIIFQHIC